MSKLVHNYSRGLLLIVFCVPGFSGCDLFLNFYDWQRTGTQRRGMCGNHVIF